MPLTIHKPHEKSAETPVLEQLAQVAEQIDKTPVTAEFDLDGMDIQEMVDRTLALDLEVAAIMEDPRIKQLDLLKKQLRQVVDEATEAGAYKPGLGVALKGTKGGRIEFSAKSLKRTVKDKAALLLLIGEELFVKLANFALGDIDKYVSADDHSKVLEIDPAGGSRMMKVVHTEK